MNDTFQWLSNFKCASFNILIFANSIAIAIWMGNILLIRSLKLTSSKCSRFWLTKYSLWEDPLRAKLYVHAYVPMVEVESIRTFCRRLSMSKTTGVTSWTRTSGHSRFYRGSCCLIVFCLVFDVPLSLFRLFVIILSVFLRFTADN